MESDDNETTRKFDEGFAEHSAGNFLDRVSVTICFDVYGVMSISSSVSVDVATLNSRLMLEPLRGTDAVVQDRVVATDMEPCCTPSPESRRATERLIDPIHQPE